MVPVGGGTPRPALLGRFRAAFRVVFFFAGFFFAAFFFAICRAPSCLDVLAPTTAC